MFIVDMKSLGLTIQPLHDIGDREPFSEVFFDDVKVPSRNLVGLENQGLPIILECLESDRFWGRCFRAPYNQRLLEEMVNYCGQTKRYGKALAKNPLIRAKLAEMTIEIEVCRLLFYRALSMLDRGKPLTYEASMAKTYADELGQRFNSSAAQILGQYCQLRRDSKFSAFDGQITEDYLSSLSYTLAGGTSEVQRNTIATRGLGLPRSS